MQMLTGSLSTGYLEKRASPYFLPSLKQLFSLTSHQKVQALTNSNLGATGHLELQEFGDCFSFPLAPIVESKKGTGVIHSPCQSSRAAHSPVAGLDLKESERASYISRISAWETWILFSTVAARPCHPVLSHSP